MSDIIKDGLPLGLRFYDTLGKQKRYQYTCAKGVSHYEYQYADGCTIPPFQLVRGSIASTDISVFLICEDTEEEFDMGTICPALEANISIKTIGSYDYITYPGTHVCCALPFVGQVLVYVRVEDGTNYWFSEFFWIDMDMEDADTYNRLWIPANDRTFDGTQLRIWR